ncbi:MAG TPA: hypothetical protein VIL37_12035 [Natronosporangium sp.]
MSDRRGDVSDVLHLQTRAYPLHYGTVDPTVRSIDVPGRGELAVVEGSLASQAYNADATLHADLTELVRAEVALPGTEIVHCRARLLSAGTVLVTYALRHDVDLRALDTAALDAFDARVNRELRQADAPVMGAVLDAAVAAGVLRHLAVISTDGIAAAEASTVDQRTVRYNCHFVTRQPPWQPDRRLPALVPGPACRILLTYTYAWDADPAAPLADLLTLLEPADITVAQMSVLFSAMFGGRRILDELAQAVPGSVQAHEFRRFLDRVWSEYHRLDFYRLESGQGHRATYLAARETIALDGAQQRAVELLEYVSNSLLAETSLRTQQLDARLNRVAAALTVVAGGSFAIDIAAFLLPAADWLVRVAIVNAVLVLAVAALIVIVLSVRSLSGRDRRPHRVPARPVPPRPRAAIRPEPAELPVE